MIIHPEFNGQWSWEMEGFDKPFMAPTIRQLIAKIVMATGKRIRVKDYYPNGDKRKTVWPNDKPTLQAAPQSQYDKFQKKEEVPVEAVVVPKKKGGGVRLYDHEAILDLWSQGWQAPKIAAKLGMPAWTLVGGIVSKYRHKGDPRAAPRTTNPNWRPDGNRREPKRLISQEPTGGDVAECGIVLDGSGGPGPGILLSWGRVGMDRE